MRALLLAAALLAATPAYAAIDHNHAGEAVMLFQKFCLADRDDARALLEQFEREGSANFLERDPAKEILGRATTEAWLVTGPATRQPLLIDYPAKDQCVLHVNNAHGGEMAKEVEALADGQGFSGTAKVEKETVEGVRTSFTTYPTRNGTIDLWAAEEAINDTQYRLRYTAN